MTGRSTSIAGAIEHELGSDGLLVVRSQTDDLRISAVDGTTARVSARHGDGLEGLDVVRGSRSLEIRSVGAAGTDLLAEVPSATSVVVETVSSDVEVDGIAGDQRYRTASGDVTLRDVGGTIDVEAMSGDIAIVVDGSARLDVRSASGDVAIRAEAITRLHAASTSGDLEVIGRFDGEGPFTIETVSGDVTIAPGADLRVDIQTITGDIHSDLAARLEEVPGRRTLTVGSGRPTVVFRSTSGDLRIARAARPASDGSAAPAPTTAAGSVPPPADDADQLAILHALERGDVDVAEARRRLDALDRGEGPEPTGDHDRTDPPSAPDHAEENHDA